MTRLRRPARWLLALLSVLALSGCVKTRVSVVVNPDDSGTFGIALGLNDEAKAFLSETSDSQNLMDDLANELAESTDKPANTEINQWVEGEFEWIEASVPFATLDELNDLVAGVEMFDSFSLTHESDILRDRYVLEAQLAPLDLGDTGTDMGSVPSDAFEGQFVVQLPGTITDTNGTEITVDGAPALMWTFGTTQSQRAYAISETWNWPIIAGIVCGVLCLGAITLGVVVAIVLVMTRKSKAKAGEAPAAA